VCEHSIEHRMLYLLGQKQSLAQEVVDGVGELKSMKIPSGRAAFMERMEAHESSPLSITFIESHLVNNNKAPANTATLVARLREAREGNEGNKAFSEKETAALLDSSAALMQHVAETLNKAALQ